MKYLLVILLFITGCGGTEEVHVSDSTQHVVFSGDANVNVNFTFIQQLITLCQQLLLPSNYATLQLYNQAVAQCVLNAASNLNPQDVNQQLNH